jgi:hypothetical protein
MIRVAVLLAAFAQLPLAVAWAEAPAANCAADSKVQTPDSNPATAIWISEPADLVCAPARGPMDLGAMDEAVRSTPSNISWKDVAPTRSMWASFEYMAVWVKESHAPSPATSGSGAASPLQENMSWQNSGTILSGSQHFDADMHSGGRFTVGAWLKDREVAVEASYFTLPAETSHFSTSTGAVPR